LAGNSPGAMEQTQKSIIAFIETKHAALEENTMRRHALLNDTPIMTTYVTSYRNFYRPIF
jgi:hypothetical protein